MSEIQFCATTRIYDGSTVPAVDQLDLHALSGEFVVLVGPSGSGKSTALRMLAGLEPVDAGEIHVGGRDVTDLPPKDRDIAMVFQNYALYPQMSVAENMAFSLKMARVPKHERAERVAHVGRMLQLDGLMDRRPAQLSGGQRQRVAMGRAIIRRPKAFLMDEPLSNLDAKLRVETRAQIAELQRSLDVTTVYVTHDQVEAMTLGDRVAVLHDGRLQQFATPGVLYAKPANRFVAGFIGSPAMNLIEAVVADDRQTASFGEHQLPLPEHELPAGAQAVIGVRPENMVTITDGVPATIRMIEHLGADTYLYCDIAGVTGGKISVRADRNDSARVGGAISLSATARDVHVFDRETGARACP
jgi:multiple sugar transport system ATP-binding protein